MNDHAVVIAGGGPTRLMLAGELALPPVCMSRMGIYFAFTSAMRRGRVETQSGLDRCNDELAWSDRLRWRVLGAASPRRSWP